MIFMIMPEQAWYSKLNYHSTPEFYYRPDLSPLPRKHLIYKAAIVKK
jgi:hypothetical protein